MKEKKYNGKYIFIFVCGSLILCSMGICYWFQSLMSVKEAQISESWAKYDEAVQELDATMNTLRDQIVENAKSSYQANGYEAAVEVIDRGLEMLENDETLIKLREQYENLRPVNLTDLEIVGYGDDYQNGEENVKKNETLKDNYGNSYNTSMSIGYQGSISWKLGGEYEKFDGVIACPEGYSSGFTTSDVTVRIYGDDQILYTSSPSGPESAPQEFNVNVSGYDTLRVEWDCDYTFNLWYNWSNYATIYDGQLTPKSV